jgi:hypothetical protein
MRRSLQREGGSVVTIVADPCQRSHSPARIPPSLYSLGTDRTENTASNSSSIVACVYAAKETCLLSRSLATAVSSRSAVSPFRLHVTILFIFLDHAVTPKRQRITLLFVHSWLHVPNDIKCQIYYQVLPSPSQRHMP